MLKWVWSLVYGRGKMVDPTDSAYVTPAEFERDHADGLAVPPGFEPVGHSGLLDTDEIRTTAAYQMGVGGICEQVSLEYHPDNDDYPFWVMWHHHDSERASTGAETFEAAVAAFEAMLETVRGAIHGFDLRLCSTLADQ